MTKPEKALVTATWQYYQVQGRRELPWRHTTDPYLILVSEMMLQQTQVDRVVPKYQAFTQQFPTAAALAAASLKEVLALWQGLGYNRRAQSLWRAAELVTRTHEGVFPTTYEELQELPGVGPYTAGAIMAFAYNTLVPIIETNIRTVYLYHIFPNRTDVADSELLPHIIHTLDTKRPREWYAALMDYGSYLKQVYGNQNTRTKHYRAQSTFQGSDRQIRGAIIRTLTALPTAIHGPALYDRLEEFSRPRVKTQLQALVKEGLVQKVGSRYTLPT